MSVCECDLGMSENCPKMSEVRVLYPRQPRGKRRNRTKSPIKLMQRERRGKFKKEIRITEIKRGIKRGIKNIKKNIIENTY